MANFFLLLHDLLLSDFTTIMCESFYVHHFTVLHFFTLLPHDLNVFVVKQTTPCCRGLFKHENMFLCIREERRIFYIIEINGKQQTCGTLVLVYPFEK